MNARLFARLTEINQSVIRFRGLYSLWSSAHGCFETVLKIRRGEENA